MTHHPSLAKTAFFLWLAAIAFMSLYDYSSTEIIDVPKLFGSGFWIHVVGYFIGAFLFNCAFKFKKLSHHLLALLFLFLMGVLFEFAQLYVPGRTYNPHDVIANGVGLVGYFFLKQGVLAS